MREVIKTIIDKIKILCIIAKHCPRLGPVTTNMYDSMHNVLSTSTAKNILSKAGLSMTRECLMLGVRAGEWAGEWAGGWVSGWVGG